MEVIYEILFAVIIISIIDYIFNNIPPDGGSGGKIA